MPVHASDRKPYKSKSVPYRDLATSTDPNARNLYYALNSHPAREYIHLGPLWTIIYKEHKKSSINIPIARKTATIAVLDIMNKIQGTIDPIGFSPITLTTLGIYKS